LFYSSPAPLEEAVAAKPSWQSFVRFTGGTP
jgi:hypothetical protein